MSNPEERSNLVHRKLGEHFATNELTVDRAKRQLALTEVLSANKGPAFAITTTIDFLCAAHAAGKDINIYRLALTELEEGK